MGEHDAGNLEAECGNSLTVILGGAGMAGGYNAEFMQVFREAGICNPVVGNYSGTHSFGTPLFDGGGTGDMLSDAASVIFYNDMNIPRSAYVFDGEDWLYKAGQDRSLWVPLEQSPSLLRIARNGNYSLARIGVAELVPSNEDQFNIVGYSWGAVIACLVARYYALAEVEIDNLVLIGAPVNGDLYEWIRTMPQIKNIIVENLGRFGDPIYLGMSDGELIAAVPELAGTMNADPTAPQVGHFYYSGSGTTDTLNRKRSLVTSLVSRGLQ